MKVAIIHYWLVSMRGGENVLENICKIYPKADIYTHVYLPSKISANINKHNIYTTFINYLPFSKKLYRYYLPLMPLALRMLKLNEYDLVISSESGPAKGVNISSKTKHICYCHSPMRYIWDMYDEYYKQYNILEKIGIKLFINHMKRWDLYSSEKIDLIIANSIFVQKRINKYWKKKSFVVNPSINLKEFNISESIDEYYIVLSEMIGYKKVNMVIDAFNLNKKKLIIIGDGLKLNKYKKCSKSNIIFLGRLFGKEKNNYLSKCKAMIFAGIEDFGIAPLEVMASGRPVLAANKGGVLEYLQEDINGMLFEYNSVKSLNDCIEKFEKNILTFDSYKIRDSIKEYSDSNFRNNFKRVLKKINVENE